MPQAHCFLATELVLKAQAQAQRVTLQGVNRMADRDPDRRTDARSGQARKASRREFMTAAGTGIVCDLGARPAFRRSCRPRCSAPHAPGNRINVGAIGTGRISRGHDLPGIWKHDSARIMAVCDLDSRRVAGRQDAGQRLLRQEDGQAVRRRHRRTRDYRELLANKDVDAVVISTPDHWHALIAIHAVEAGKDVYLQKPASLTIAEGRALSNAVHRSGRIFQIGSQQRSSPQFRYAAELVRNGRIGQLKTVEVGLPGDPSGDDEPEMPVPKNLNYDVWLGSTPVVPYTEKRVHPQAGYDRPGWLRCEQFGAGHDHGLGRAPHRQRALGRWARSTRGRSRSGASAEFPTKGLWDVHGPFKTEALYANGVRMIVSGDFPNGIKFIGTEGWIFVSRGNETVTASDPVAKLKDSQALAASDPKIITSVIGPGRDPPVREHGSSRQLARVRALARSSRSRRWKSRTGPARRACSITSR